MTLTPVKALGDSRFLKSLQRLEEALYKSAQTPCVVTPLVGGIISCALCPSSFVLTPYDTKRSNALCHKALVQSLMPLW